MYRSTLVSETTEKKTWLPRPQPCFSRHAEAGLTCGLAVLGVAQVAQGTFVISQVVEGDACSVHGLEVVPLVAQHLQTVLLHPLVVDQLRLQQAGCNDKQACSQINALNKKPNTRTFLSAV